MRKNFILLLLILFAKNSQSQNEISDCIKKTFTESIKFDSSGNQMLDFFAWTKCVIEKQIPDFITTSISGDTIQMSKLKGKIVVINFWFIDCHPCIAEMPALNKLVDEYKNKEVVFLAITWEVAKRVYNDFLSKYKLDFIILPDAQKVIDKVAGSGYPTTYILNQKGIIKAAWNGGSTSEKAETEYYEKAKPFIDELLKAE